MTIIPSRYWVFTLAIITIIATLPLFFGQFPSTSDMRDVYIPLEDFFQQHQKKGQLPAWQPLAAWGFPVIASGQIGFFYPPLLLARQVFPFPFYLSGIVIIHLFSLSLGTFFLARRYKLSLPAASLVSIAFTYGAFIWQHVIHLNIFLVLAWLPWQLWYSHRLSLQQSFTSRQTATLALLLGIPFLVGQFQIPTLIVLVTGIQFLYLRWPQIKNTPHSIRRLLVPIIITALLAIALTSAQILPTLELLPYSSRNNTSGQFDITRANQYSYPLYHLPTIVFPRFYDTDDNYWGKRLEVEYGFFFGTIPLLLVIYAVRYRHFHQSRENKFLIILALSTFLLSLGSFSPFRLIGIEPSLWVFSAPARWLLFTSLALSLLAGRALDTINLNGRTWHKFLVITLFILGISISLVNIGLFSPRTTSLADKILTIVNSNTPYNQEKIASILTSAQSSSLSLRSPYTYLPLLLIMTLLLLRKYPPRTQSLAIIGLTTVELLIINPPAIVMDNWSKILERPSSSLALPDTIKNQQARFFSIRENTDTGAFFTNPNSRGGEIENELRTNLIVPLTHTQYGLASVEWPASLNFASQEPILASLRKPNSYELTEVAAAENLNIGAVIAPSKFSLPELEASATSVTATDLVTLYQLNPAPRIQLKSNNGQSPGQIRSQTITSTGNMQLEVETSQPTQLIIRDTYYPGWQATINNHPTEIHTEPPFFRSITLPSGHSQVTIKYHPQKLYVGTILSALALIISLTMVIFTKRPANATLNS